MPGGDSRIPRAGAAGHSGWRADLNCKEAVSIIGQLVNACWYLFKWVLGLTLLTVAVVGGYLYLRLDDEIRRYAEGMLAAHYEHLDVRLGSARFEAGRGILLYDLSIWERPARGTPRQLLHVDELQLLGHFDLESLAASEPAIQKIVAIEPKLLAHQGEDGTWNLSALYPLPSTSDNPADLAVVDAEITLSGGRIPTGKSLVVSNVSFELVASQNQDTSQPGHHYLVEGSVTGPLAKSIGIKGTFDPASHAMQGDVHVVGLALSNPWIRLLVVSHSGLSNAIDFSGNLDLNLHLARASANVPLTWNADYRLTGGRVAMEGLPRQFTGLDISGTTSQDQWVIRSAQGRYGKAGVTLVGVGAGWGAHAPRQFEARIGTVPLDDSMAELLPPAGAELWDRFRPAGDVSAHVRLGYNGQRWIPDVTVTCQNASFEDNLEFPYRVHGGAGTLRFFDAGDASLGQLEVHLTAQAAGRPIAIKGHLKGFPSLDDTAGNSSPSPPLPPPHGWFEVTGTQVGISSDLVAALEDDAEEIVRMLKPQGHFSFRWSFRCDVPGGQSHTETDLEFHNCQIQFDRFPYPLSHINGRIYERDDRWRFEDLVSRPPTSPAIDGATGPSADPVREVRCHGTCHPSIGGYQIDLTITGTEVPLDETLGQSLPLELQSTWKQLNPAGRVAFTAKVSHQTGDTHPHVEVEAIPSGQTVSVYPTFYRYRLEGIQGKLECSNGQVRMTQFRASHGRRTTLSASSLQWSPTPQGGWQFDVTGLNVDRLAFTGPGSDELLLDAPPRVREIVGTLKPQGTFSIHDGKVLLARPTAASPHMVSHWNLRLGCQQNHIDMGIPLRNVSGLVNLSGMLDGSHSFVAGQLDIDSLFWQGMQFTRLRGPIWLDGLECRLGLGASQRFDQYQIANTGQRTVEADYYGGKLRFDAHVRQDNSQYTIEATLDNADLGRMSTEYFANATSLTGTLGGRLSLSGMGQSLELLSGGGQVRVRNATLGELPILVSMLKVLRNRAPDTTAFNGVDSQFRIVGKRVHFEHLDLLGDAISLKGKGTADFDRQLDLVFYSYMGRHEIGVPVLRWMAGQASANLLQISVKGSVDNPQVNREALPAVSSMFEQLNDRAIANPPAAPSGSWWR